LIEKGLIFREEFMQKISEERADVSEADESHPTITSFDH
jgi:sRNA-binding carbon storage regulator CsrA